MQAVSKSQVFRKLMTGTVVATCLMLGFLAALTGYRATMTDRVFYGVALGGNQLGGMSAKELHAVIQSRALAIEQSPLTLDQTSTTTTLQDLGISINATTAIEDALEIGREGSIGQQLLESFVLLSSPRAVAWQFEASDATLPALHELLADSVRESQDAQYQLIDDSVVVQSDVLGTTVDVPATLAQLETSYLRGVPTVLRVALVPSIAPVTSADLEATRSTVLNILATPVALDVQGKHVTPAKSDVLSWIRPVRTDQGVQLAYDEPAMAVWVDQASSHIEQKSIDRQVLSTGTVISEGRVGREVDTTETTSQLKNALAVSAKKPVIVLAVVKRTEPQTRVVAADTTAGLVDGKYVEVDLSSQMLYQYEGQTLIASYRVSTGKASTPTPTGTYAINGGKSPRAYSASFGLYLPSWMPFIGSSYGLHALPEWPGGYKEGENHLGIAVSHGCVRLSTASAAALYDWADVGTTVIIHR